MSRLSVLRPVVATALMAAVVPAVAAGTTLLSFESDPPAGERLLGWNGTVTRIKSKATQGKYSVRLDAPANVAWSYATYERADGFNLTANGTLISDVFNAGTEAASAIMVVEDMSGKTLRIDFSVPAGEWAHPCMLLKERRKPSAFGLRDYPRVAPEARMIVVESWNDGSANLGAIKKIHLALRGTDKAQSLYIDNYRTTPALDMDAFLTGWIDKYGQNDRMGWAGKIKVDADLAAAKEEEEAQLAAWTRPTPDTDVYGGDTTRTGGTATGFFRVQKMKSGTWFFITPLGNRFWSFGVNTVGTNETGNIVDGREAMFQRLPTANSASSAITKLVQNGKTVTAVNFQKANIDRKYGVGRYDLYRSRLVERMDKWGLNTIGAFSDSELVQNATKPITPSVSSYGTLKISVPLLDRAPGIPDPYDPLFSTKLAANTWVMRPNDPMVVGYFVDNILPFSSSAGRNYEVALGLAVMELNTLTSPAKGAMVEALQAKYASISDLNAAWNTSFSSWAALAAGYTLSNRANAALVNDAMYSDLREFMKSFARRYFQLTRDVLKSADPNHMYLGCRLDTPDEEIVKIMSEYADVASVMVYQTDVTAGKWAFLKTMDRPVIIGEYGFTTYERGTPGVLCEKETEVDKAAAYKAYVKQCLKTPCIVGAHIFQFCDQNPHGNSWGNENCNHGLVDITDTPYPYMVSATRELAQTIYSTR